ncbi:sensor histidine kinase [Variovorax sp. HJSM1_2]|uniref:sensor histidine kinase n=1 Tax=Variovorax sp. HJSM1_2 TaxID=3366263 RepID=UPI003BB9C371
MTLRRRVMLAMVALVALFTAIQGSLAVLSMHDQEDDLVDDLVLAETRRLASRVTQDGTDILDDDIHTLLPDDYQAWWVGPDGRAIPAPLPKSLEKLPSGPHIDSAEGGEYHIMIMPVAGGHLFVRYNAARNEDKVQLFALHVFLLALVVIVLAAWIAHYLAGLLIAPLEKVAQLLDHWAPASEPGAISAQDEEQRVLDAFERVQVRWEHGLARERERFADIHHEIRTPLAALRTDLEMLQMLDQRRPGPAAPPGSDAAFGPRLQRAMSTVDAIAGALESMHSLQTGRNASVENVPLSVCVADAWASLGELPTARALTLSNEVDAQACALVDRQALMAILRNLFRNAAEHAAPAILLVRFEDGQILVSDNGPGIPAQDMPFVFERYYRGRLADTSEPRPADSSNEYERGLGLAIARQVAEANGWRLTVGDAHPKGTQFRLSF